MAAVPADAAGPVELDPPAISLSEIAPWALFALALVALLYLVGVEEGATALTPGRFLHELAHDGRHLLSFPCH